ncbi:MAG: ABC transporter ATP-binding protein [Sporichthyaceae bacterium]
MSEMRVRALRMSFGAVPVLTGLDLDVAEHSITAVLGPSGCGKTTLLRLIAGFGTPDAGEIHLGTTRVSWAGGGIPPERRKVGIVPQEGALFPHLSVERNVAFGLAGRSCSRTERTTRVGDLLELVGLGGYQTRMPHELSGGQQQRVALARALAPRPSLVLLDEPFSALDSGLRGTLREDVRSALRAAGATAVLVTHDQTEALSMADSVAVMRAGQVVQCATPEQIYRAPADLGVAAFVGAAVLLPARVQYGFATCVLGNLQVRDDGASGSGGGAEGTVLIRPEQVELGPLTSGVRAVVGRRAYHGHESLIRLTVSFPGNGNGAHAPVEITARATGDRVIDEGAEVGITVHGPVGFYPATGDAGRSTAPGSGSTAAASVDAPGPSARA